jgi:Predicted membrane protein
MTETVYLLFPIIYALINAASYALYGIDKFKARKDKWRISEQSLLIVSFFGPIGALLGMQQFRHKTQKPIFRFLVPAFVGIHILLVLWINF